MTSKQKLELTWLGKDKEIKIEPRILIENKELSNIENDHTGAFPTLAWSFIFLPLKGCHLNLIFINP